MRYYVEDPDNEDRIIKLPPELVDRLMAEGRQQAITAIDYHWQHSTDDDYTKSVFRAAADVVRFLS